METHGVVLAGGRSSRMGKPKALLNWAGESFLDHVLGAYEGGGLLDICVVVGGPHAAAIERAIADRRPGAARVRVATNPDVDSGPIGSLRIGAAAWIGAPGAILAHPVDIPGVTASDVRTVLDAARSQHDADAVIASVNRRRAHPVWLAPSLVARLAGLDPTITLRDVLRDPATRVAYALLDNPRLLHDVDTPRDLAWLTAQRR